MCRVLLWVLGQQAAPRGDDALQVVWSRVLQPYLATLALSSWQQLLAGGPDGCVNDAGAFVVNAIHSHVFLFHLLCRALRSFVGGKSCRVWQSGTLRT